MPLMKRTVREESGAWSLLKKAAVRASDTASSLVSTCTPKFPIASVGAAGLRYTARMFPARSTTAMAIVLGSAACAAAWTSVVTSAAVRFGVGEGGVTDVKPPTAPPQPVVHAYSANTDAKKIPRNDFCLLCQISSGAMRGHRFGITSHGGTQGTRMVCATIITGADAFVASAFRLTLQIQARASLKAGATYAQTRFARRF